MAEAGVSERISTRGTRALAKGLAVRRLICQLVRDCGVFLNKQSQVTPLDP